MRLTQFLQRQHIGYHFDNLWRIQGKRKPLKTGAEKVLKQRNINVCKPEDILEEKRELQRVEVVGWKKDVVPKFSFNEKPLLTYTDNNVLLAGLNQAKILTKTVEIDDELPSNFHPMKLSKETHETFKEIILYSNLFDAEQKKLAKIKDPERPMFNFPRVYGITQNRKFSLLITKLLQLIESSNDWHLTRDRYLFNDLNFCCTLKNVENVQFSLNSEFMLTSSQRLKNQSIDTTPTDLPDIYPMNFLISLNEEHYYQIQNDYPINKNVVNKFHPHTMYVNFDKENVKNLYEEECTEEQIQARTLLKAFTIAASYAKNVYGDDVKVLPEPVSVQIVQSDCKFYQFGLFQLNTLELEKVESDLKNIYFRIPTEYLYEKCCYEQGKPVLFGYNKKVLELLNAFYNN